LTLAGDGKAGNAFPVQPRAIWRGAALITLLTIGLVALVLSDAVHAALTDALTASQAIIVGHPVLGPLLSHWRH
jgi:hypothetical protein